MVLNISQLLIITIVIDCKYPLRKTNKLIINNITIQIGEYWKRILRLCDKFDILVNEIIFCNTDLSVSTRTKYKMEIVFTVCYQ